MYPKILGVWTNTSWSSGPLTNRQQTLNAMKHRHTGFGMKNGSQPQFTVHLPQRHKQAQCVRVQRSTRPSLSGDLWFHQLNFEKSHSVNSASTTKLVQLALSLPWPGFQQYQLPLAHSLSVRQSGENCLTENIWDLDLSHVNLRSIWARHRTDKIH